MKKIIYILFFICIFFLMNMGKWRKDYSAVLSEAEMQFIQTHIDLLKDFDFYNSLSCLTNKKISQEGD